MAQKPLGGGWRYFVASTRSTTRRIRLALTARLRCMMSAVLMSRLPLARSSSLNRDRRWSFSSRMQPLRRWASVSYGRTVMLVAPVEGPDGRHDDSDDGYLVMPVAALEVDCVLVQL